MMKQRKCILTKMAATSQGHLLLLSKTCKEVSTLKPTSLIADLGALCALVSLCSAGHRGLWGRGGTDTLLRDALHYKPYIFILHQLL